MRPFLTLLFTVAVTASAAAQTPSATTQTGTTSKGTPKVYTFTPSAFGQVTATLSWDAQNAHLVMVLVCGPAADVQTFAIGAAFLDRFARFESGVIGGEPCGLAVTTADETANFRLHVIRSGDQFLSPAATSGVVELTEARDGTLLGDRALQVSARLHQALRSIRR